MQQESLAVEVPKQVKSILAITKENEDNLAKSIDRSIFKLPKTKLTMYDKSSKQSFKNVCKQLTAHDLDRTFIFWVQKAQ